MCSYMCVHVGGMFVLLGVWVCMGVRQTHHREVVGGLEVNIKSSVTGVIVTEC